MPGSSISPPCAPRGEAMATTLARSIRWCPWTYRRSPAVDAYARTTPSPETRLEERNNERYQFPPLGSKVSTTSAWVPPATGIVHQVNLEYLAKGVLKDGENGETLRLPRHPRRHRLAHHHDQRPRRPRLGRRRHRAEAAMLGQPLYMVTPRSSA